jgi:hypothetical protein
MFLFTWEDECGYVTDCLYILAERSQSTLMQIVKEIWNGEPVAYPARLQDFTPFDFLYGLYEVWSILYLIARSKATVCT